jgi:hypothetical protein
MASHTSHKLQPCDVGVFAPLKAAYRVEAEQLWRGSVNTVGKEHCTALYSCARKEAFTQRNIKAGWAKARLFPFSPDRVLGGMQKPCTELDSTKTNEVIVKNPSHSEVLQTPVTAEEVLSLQGYMERNAHAQDEASKQRLLTCAHKISKCAQTSIAEGALLKDENKLLFKQNNEAKVRRSAKPKMVGKAKVMKYEDIEIERRRLAMKEADVAAKKSRQKRKDPTITRAAQSKKARRSEVKIAEDEVVTQGMGEYCSVFQVDNSTQ